MLAAGAGIHWLSVATLEWGHVLFPLERGVGVTQLNDFEFFSEHCGRRSDDISPKAAF